MKYVNYYFRSSSCLFFKKKTKTNYFPQVNFDFTQINFLKVRGAQCLPCKHNYVHTAITKSLITVHDPSGDQG